MNPGLPRRAVAGISLWAVLGATLVTLGLGYALKLPCASGMWGDGRQYKVLCYSDIVPLYGTEQLQGSRLPYLQRCEGTCDEYPVLTMYLMRTAAWISQPLDRGYAMFFNVNVLLLTAFALVTSWSLYRMVGVRALYFALAPTLFAYGFMNWDLFAVMLATLGTLMFLSDRDGWSGAFLGLGTAAKGYPALFVIPFAADRFREGRRLAGVALVLAAAGTWAVVNIPFAIAAPHAWGTFFRFNASRGADWDSLWFVACDRLGGGHGTCTWPASVLNPVSALVFVAAVLVVWMLRWNRLHETPAWTLGFPIVALFLLTNKVYSPQYGLWLLPWFALALPNLRLFVAFEAADMAVFVTRFLWFARLDADAGAQGFAPGSGLPLWIFQVALVVRAVVLVGCVAAWVLRDPLPVDIPEASPLRRLRALSPG
ncbi:MAG TPA: glycosyltransferase 87 family protein [Actinomycetota bacterium]|nr:glycosyltransferase 87 family protein [Actinomycetota bacterium]